MTSNRPLATVLVGATTVATAVSFSRVFEFWDYLAPLVSVAVLAHLSAFLMRRQAILVSILAQVSLVYTLNAWIHVHETLWYGVPLGRTLTEISTRISVSDELLGEVTPPLEFATGFGLVAGFSVGMAAILADAFAFRAAGRGEALVPSAVVFAAVSIVGEDRHRLLVTTIFLFTTLVALTHLRRVNPASVRATDRKHTRTTATTAATAAVVALVAAWVGPRIPGANSEPLIGSDTDSAQIIEPLVDIRRRLADRSDVVLFTVTADRPSYWKLTSLAEFDGSTWGVTERELNAAGGRLGNGYDAESWTVTQSFVIGALSGVMAPAAYETTQLRAASRSLYYSPESGTLLVDERGLSPSDSYVIDSEVSDPAAPQLERLPSLSPPSAKYLEIPDNEEMKELGDLARDIVIGADSGFQAAIDLQNYFRDNFQYSLDAPRLGGERSHVEFIERRSGYCEQFSSTFAAMARAIGLPARVAVGFTPGATDGGGTFTVRGQHAHAWPEVWFDGVGWLMFEPTPGRGAPDRDYTGVEPQQDDTPPTETAPAQTTTSNPASTVPPTPESPPPTTEPTDVDPSRVSSGSGPNATAVILIVLVLMVLSWPLVVRQIVSRVARVDPTADLIVLWRRLLAEEGFASGPDLTPTEIAERLSSSTIRAFDDPDDVDVARRLARAIDKLLFAERSPSPEELSELNEAVERWIASLRPPRHRWARYLSPKVALRLAGRR